MWGVLKKLILTGLGIVHWTMGHAFILGYNPRRRLWISQKKKKKKKIMDAITITDNVNTFRFDIA